MNVVFDDSVGAQARQWFADALASSTIDFDAAITTTVTVVVVAEPSAPGHNDYACTSAIPGGWLIEIRRGLDDPASPLVANIPGPAHLFFMETIAHELAHVLIGQGAADPTVLCPLFVRIGQTGTVRIGTVADWNISTRPSVVASKWEDRIEEAVAETIKDAALPDRRVYDNRTNWRIAERDFPALMSALLGGPGGVGFYESFTVDHTAAWFNFGDTEDGVGTSIVVQAGAAYDMAGPSPLENIWGVNDMIYGAGDRGQTWPVSNPFNSASFPLDARGPPHPVTVRFCSLTQLDNQGGPMAPDATVTFKVVRISDGAELTPELVAYVYPDQREYGPFWMDVAMGELLCVQCTATSNVGAGGAGLSLTLAAPITPAWQTFGYGVPVEIPAGWRMGCKAVFSPDQPGGLGHQGADCQLGMAKDEYTLSVTMNVEDGVMQLIGGNIRQSDGNGITWFVQVPVEIDFTVGGTWWFTMEVNAERTAVRGSIWSSKPYDGETPDFSYEETGVSLVEPGVLRLAEFGGGGVAVYPDATIPVSYTHYDDWFAIPYPAGTEAPDWPYVPAFVVGAAGAPAFLRVG